ncbi:MAG: endonuclease/exonuclease/phosphatase family protein [Eubacterium sp.]|nr:endonuclease/exonuclease/phosphatase family protein [Eubacterium sp.]
MKKALKIPLTLLLLFAFGAAIFAGAISIRGNYDKYILPDGFEEAVSKADTSRSDDTYARIMSANLLVNYESWGGTDAHKRAKMFFYILGAYKPDVVAIQEMSNQWYCCLTKNRGSFRLVYPVSSGAMLHMTGLMYNSDTVTLLDYGRMEYTQGDNKKLRRIVWGFFEDNETKKQYVVTSTHFDLIRKGNENEELNIMNTQASEQLDIALKLEKRFNCPVISAGDFNAMDNGGYDNQYYAPTVYNTIAQTLTDTKYIAKTKTDGDGRNVDKPTFDHIFLKGDVAVNRYSIISDSVMTQMSDHYPIFADIA